MSLFVTSFSNFHCFFLYPISLSVSTFSPNNTSYPFHFKGPSFLSNILCLLKSILNPKHYLVLLSNTVYLATNVLLFVTLGDEHLLIVTLHLSVFLPFFFYSPRSQPQIAAFLIWYNFLTVFSFSFLLPKFHPFPNLPLSSLFNKSFNKMEKTFLIVLQRNQKNLFLRNSIFSELKNCKFSLLEKSLSFKVV